MKTKKITNFLVFSLVFSILFLNLVSAVTVTNVNTQELFPGESAPITLTIKNNLDETIKDISLSLTLDKTSFITLGSSEDNVDEIKKGRQTTFEFQIKAPNNIKPGNYNLPYSITYTYNDKLEQKQGSFGITVSVKTELSFSAETDQNIINKKGKVSLKIINNGLGEVRFVSVKLIPIGFTSLSPNEVYIGTVNSDDFETASFDVIYISQNAKLSALVNYRDFDNNLKTEIVDLPINVYTNEQALQLGLVQKSYTWVYILVVLVVIIAWFIYRKIKKKKTK